MENLINPKVLDDFYSSGFLKCAAIDLGTTSGYCLFDIRENLFTIQETGNICFGLRKKFDWVNFVDLYPQHMSDNFDVVFYEDVKKWSSSAAAKRYGGLLGVSGAHRRT